MKVQLKFTAGARTGQVEVFSKAYLGLGRDPLSDVRFDAERDLDVSARHAAILRRGAQFFLRDMGSKNGTYLNGRSISADSALKDGDVIGFGPGGPTVEFHILEADVADDVPDAVRASASRASAPREQFKAVAPRIPTAEPQSHTGLRIAAEVQRQTRALRRTTKILLGLLTITIAGFAWVQWKSLQSAREIAALQQRADSLNRAAHQLLSQFQTELQDVREALRQAQTESAELRTELAIAGSSGDASRVALLRSRLDSAEARQRGLADAAGVDYRRISQANTDAVALVLVKFSDQEVFSGTAFAIDSQGTLVTNKHVLAGEDGTRRPLGVAVKFSGSRQWFQAQVLGVADSADLGVLKVNIRGGNPKVLGLAGAGGVQRGDPVAIIGYPLGEDLPMEHQGQTAVADPTLTVGTVSKVLSDVVQVDGYGAPGSSGSPVFDRDGHVVAVLYGGQRESQGKIVFAVPASLVVTLLKNLGVAH